jgi:hypothetical protein
MAKGLRGKTDFACAFKLIWAVQSRPQKYSASLFRKFMIFSRLSRLIDEGRCAIVTKRGVRDVMGGPVCSVS